ncbi:hypothetical protein ACFX2G_004030 [Malus domestica]
MAACAFDLKFLYVLAGWEGSASDLQVLNSTLIRQNKLQMLSDWLYWLQLAASNQQLTAAYRYLPTCSQHSSCSFKASHYTSAVIFNSPLVGGGVQKFTFVANPNARPGLRGKVRKQDVFRL